MSVEVEVRRGRTQENAWKRESKDSLCCSGLFSAWILNRVQLTRDTMLPESIKFRSMCWEKEMESHTNSDYKGVIQNLLV